MVHEYFIVPDLHGRPQVLRDLLRAAGCIDEEGTRTDELEYDYLVDDGADPARLERRSFKIISIGDLLNATLVDQAGDEESLLLARDWFDYLILGNHESGYLFGGMSFNGYWESPPIASLYRQLHRQGVVVPAVLVGETLLSHAGVHAYFDFRSAEEAFEAIYDVWENYPSYEADYSKKFYFSENIEIPKSLLLNGVSSKRGGGAPMGGILWADWIEYKNDHFSQIVGHSPKKNGPIVTTYHGTGVFHANIDCSAKSGLVPTGVWLNEYGEITEYVTIAETSTVAG